MLMGHYFVFEISMTKFALHFDKILKEVLDELLFGKLEVTLRRTADSLTYCTALNLFSVSAFLDIDVLHFLSYII